MVIIPQTNALPDKRTRAYKLLELVAVFGEFPTRSLSRLSGGESYTETVVRSLKRRGLIKTHYRDGLRGLRLTVRAKELLLADNPARFSHCLDRHADTNHIRSEPARRERLHRIAEATLTMKNAGVAVFRDERPAVFLPTYAEDTPIIAPAFYNSREVKESGVLFAKTKGARSVGTLLTEHHIFVTYNMGASLMKWEYKAEMRAKAFTETLLCLHKFPTYYAPADIKGLLLGDCMDLAYEILLCKRKHYFILDDNYENFYYITNDRAGETVLRLLCDPALTDELDDILTEDLYPARPGYIIENDGMTEDDRPVLLAYTCDLKRIRKFVSALDLHEKYGVLICFDFQADALRRICGERVELQTLDLQKTERRLFP